MIALLKPVLRNWGQTCIEIGASWTHNGDIQNVPFVRTSSGFISSGCFRGRKVQERPDILEAAAVDLLNHPELAAYLFTPSRHHHLIDRVVGGATSGIALASYIAREAGAKTAIVDIDKERRTFSCKGFDLQPGERVIIADDTVTTGRTFQGVRDALREVQPDLQIIPVVLALCNRSNETSIAGFSILSLITRDLPRWNDGENPFTPDGKEVLPPVSVKDCV